MRKVALVTAADDGLGKDWAERWRVAQWDGIAPVLAALYAFAEPAIVTPRSAPPAAEIPTAETSPLSEHDELMAEVLADPIIQELRTVLGVEVVDVQPMPLAA